MESNEQIAHMVEKIAREYEPERIILFGSHASGSAGLDSDIDLLIIKDTAERFIDRFVTVRLILSDPGRNVPVDIIVLTPKELSDRLAKGDQFMAEIMENGKVLYAA